MNQKLWAFAIYSVLYEALIFGLFGYAVFWQGHSGWWMVLAVAMSMCQLKPKHFGMGDVDASDTAVLDRVRRSMKEA